MGRVTKFDLIQDAAVHSGRSQINVQAVVEALLKYLPERAAFNASNGCDIAYEVRGWGTFYTKERKPRPGRNPRTGVSTGLIPQRWVFLWKPNPDLKLRMNAHPIKDAA